MVPLLLDEDSINRALVSRLRVNGLDVVTVADVGRRGLPDEDQLAFATSQGRAVFTCNVQDFARLHAEWLRTGLHHAGIIVLTEQRTPIGMQIAALTRLAQAFDPDTIRDRLEFLSNWQD